MIAAQVQEQDTKPKPQQRRAKHPATKNSTQAITGQQPSHRAQDMEPGPKQTAPYKRPGQEPRNRPVYGTIDDARAYETRKLDHVRGGQGTAAAIMQ